MAGSEVARLMREIDEAYQAAKWALTGLAFGTARHDFINAKQERIAACHEELNALVGPDAAIKLVAQVYFQDDQDGPLASSEEEAGKGA